MLLPAVNGPAPTSARIERSAVGVADVEASAVVELFPMIGSFSLAATEALLVSVPGVAGDCTTIPIVAEDPDAIVPTLQVTGPAPLHVPLLGFVETSVVPAGRLSVT